MLNLTNFKRKGNKFNRAKEMIKAERKDFGELLIKQIGTIDAQLKPAKDHMVQKDH